MPHRQKMWHPKHIENHEQTVVAIAKMNAFIAIR